MKEKISPIILILWASLLFNVFSIVALTVYAFVMNKTAHTGFEPYDLYWLYIPAILLSLMWIGSAMRNKKIKGLIYACFLSAVTAMLYITWLDASNNLVQYDRWLQRGSPEKGASLFKGG